MDPLKLECLKVVVVAISLACYVGGIIIAGVLVIHPPDTEVGRFLNLIVTAGFIFVGSRLMSPKRALKGILSLVK